MLLGRFYVGDSREAIVDVNQVPMKVCFPTDGSRFVCDRHSNTPQPATVSERGSCV